MAYKPGDLIYIEWEDAVASGGGWKSPEETNEWFKNVDMLVKEVGWVHTKTDKFIGLYSRRSIWGSDVDDCEYGILQKIPTTWIRKVEVIKKGNIKNKK